MITVCFHGAESTGKSTLAAQLSLEHGWAWVPEYGRTYCEERGIDLTMDDLLAIARGEQAAIEQAAVARPEVLLIDTDQLMTAAWAEMLFGTVPDELLTYPHADLYLLFDADVPWIGDGTRFFGNNEERQRFAAMAEHVLNRCGVRWMRIAGSWEERATAVRVAIRSLIEERKA